MDKGITIALQSRNPNVLTAIKRKNLDDGKLSAFLEMYNEGGVPAYVEIILGLPEETLESFIDGVCDVIELEQHNYIGIYSMTALPNTPFGLKDYIDKYELKILNTYTAFNHYDISEQNEFEREDMVVASRTMTFKDYKDAHYFRWIVMAGHFLGLTQFISRFYRTIYNVSYKSFYTKLLNYAYDYPESFLGKELKATIASLENTLDAKQPWGRIIQGVKKNFAWDFEEATVINVSKNKEIFYEEIKHFLKTYLKHDIKDEVLEDLFKYQKSGLIDPAKRYPAKELFDYNIHDIICNKDPLKTKKNKLVFSADNYDGDYYEWGKEKLWWGRRIGACKAKVEVAQV